MASAFWMKQKGKRVLGYKHRGADGQWVGPLRAKGCRTLEQAQRLADDKERQAERHRHGLEALPGEEQVTFGGLLDRWWDREGRRRRSESKHAFKASLEKHLGELRSRVLNAATAGAFAEELQALLEDKLEGGELAPQTLNHLRSGAFRVFEYARHPKCRLWRLENPIGWVKRWKVPKPQHVVLRREEVAPVLAALPEPRLGAPWRWMAALCLYTGARPGEAAGAWKDDIDWERWVLNIRRSWTSPVPKDDDARLVPIPPELRPLLKAAALASPNHLLFPTSRGEVFDPETRRDLVDKLRAAAAAAGVVVGYSHTCRRCVRRSRLGGPDAPSTFVWMHPDAEQRRCPNCNMKLWIKAIPKPIRFYDLRHTNATLLREARVDLGTVQRNLGHASPDTTEYFYDHSDALDDRQAVERVLTLNAQPVVAVSAEGLTTGSPQPVTPPAAGAPDADPASPASEQFPPVSKR
jgi:integrase